MLIAFTRRWEETGWVDSQRVSASVGLFNAGRCNSFRVDADAYFHLPAPRSAPSPIWRVARSPSGWPVLFSGWIDNRDSLIDDFPAHDAPANLADNAEFYGAALETWGDSTDSRMIGSYAAIVALPDGRIRLSRSPWNGMPLFYAADSVGVAIASVPRPIFAAGWPERLREDAIARLLAFRTDHDQATPYEGVHQLPSGCVVHIARHEVTLDRWYDPLALKPTVLDSDEAYVDRANTLLREAVQAALKGACKPGLQLSGGLDSGIVADEMLRALPEPSRLRTYTFHPLDEASAVAPPTLYADERPYVAEFLATHPRIEPSFVDNREVSFDNRARALFLAGGNAFPGLVLASAHYGCFEAAAQDGCDWLFHAGMGNITISNDSPWVWPEFFARGQWRELWCLLRNRPGDKRSVLRRFIAHGLLPNLPAKLQDTLRNAVHGKSVGNGFGNALLQDGGPAATQADHDPSEGIATAGEMVRTRAEWLEQTYRNCGTTGEMPLAYAQVFGLRLRDVTQYRPLIEFCITIPTEQLARDGQRRFLARRMARGRMPEAQRLNPRVGMHNADWHHKMARDLDGLRRRVEAFADHPVIGPSIDLEKARALIDSFPAQAPANPTAGAEWRFHLPAAMLIADYVDFVTGRNAH